MHPYPKDLVIATKCGLVRPKPSRWDEDARPEKLRKDLEGSLKRLKLDCLHLWQLHAPDPRVPLEESLGVMADAQRAGKVRHIGVSNFSVKRLARARKVAKIVSVQNRYSLDDRNEEDVLAHCEKLGIAFLPWYPLGAGSAVRASKIKRVAKKARRRAGAGCDRMAPCQIAGDAAHSRHEARSRISRRTWRRRRSSSLAKTWPSSTDGSGAADSPRRPGRARRRGHGPQPRAPRAPAEATGGAPGASRCMSAAKRSGPGSSSRSPGSPGTARTPGSSPLFSRPRSRSRRSTSSSRTASAWRRRTSACCTFPCHQRRTDRGVGALLDWRAERAGAPRLRRAFLGHHGVRRDGRVLVGARLHRMAQPAAC